MGSKIKLTRKLNSSGPETSARHQLGETQLVPAEQGTLGTPGLHIVAQEPEPEPGDGLWLNIMRRGGSVIGPPVLRSEVRRH